MASNTIPLAIPDDLLEEVRDTAADTHLSQADVMRQSMKMGLPVLRRTFEGRKMAALKGKSLADVISPPSEVVEVSFPSLGDSVRKVSL